MSKMPQIGAEVAGFLLAVIAGGVARLLYQSLVCFRELVRHSYLAMGIEDILYWMGTAVYFFVQIYYTSSGGIRWSFLLGCVGGAAFASFLIKKIDANSRFFPKKIGINESEDRHKRRQR